MNHTNVRLSSRLLKARREFFHSECTSVPGDAPASKGIPLYRNSSLAKDTLFYSFGLTTFSPRGSYLTTLVHGAVIFT